MLAPIVHHPVSQSVCSPTNCFWKTNEGFLRKNIVAVSFFSKLLYTHILNTVKRGYFGPQWGDFDPQQKMSFFQLLFVIHLFELV